MASRTSEVPKNPAKRLVLLPSVKFGSIPQVAPLPAKAPEPNNDVAIVDTLGVLRRSGLLDVAFYLNANPDIAKARSEPFEHFLRCGDVECRQPNFYFEPVWYIQHYPETTAGAAGPLLHYLSRGDRAGFDPGPLFNTAWYRQAYSVPLDETCLGHYLQHCKAATVSPMPEFDVAFYVKTNPDVVSAQVDPFFHFLKHGYKEGRNPSRAFDLRYYRERYLRNRRDDNPFLHWLEHRHLGNVQTRMLESEHSIPREIKRFTEPSPYFEAFAPLRPAEPRRAKVLAFYLPQFHAFAENDRWWGTGFTEWTNIARGVPRFVGHYQPRIPRDLGFYALNDSDTLRRQIAMAQASGIFGFIFYFYYFAGKRLMERPLEILLGDPSLDMPFALMWANENWTRAWDGGVDDVLIGQDYESIGDERLVAQFAMHFKDRRYIRIQGRPVIMVYRPKLIPHCAERMEVWRRLFKESIRDHLVF